MDFSLVHFNIDRDENYPTKTVILSNPLHVLEVISTPHGLVVGFTDSFDSNYEWYEDGKEWIDEDRNVCSTPTEWDENFWWIVRQAEKLIDNLAEISVGGN